MLVFSRNQQEITILGDFLQEITNLKLNPKFQFLDPMKMLKLFNIFEKLTKLKLSKTEENLNYIRFGGKDISNSPTFNAFIKNANLRVDDVGGYVKFPSNNIFKLFISKKGRIQIYFQKQNTFRLDDLYWLLNLIEKTFIEN